VTLFVKSIGLYRATGRIVVICVFVLALNACVVDDFSFSDLDIKMPSSASLENDPEFDEDYMVASRREISSEDLLENDDALSLVEQGRDYDPARAHLEARKRVNTKRRRTDKDLAAHFKPDAKSGRDETFRILRMQGSKSADRYKNVKVSGRSVSTPTGTVSDKAGFSSRLSRLFSLQPKNDAVVIPGVKPDIPWRYRRETSFSEQRDILALKVGAVVNGIVLPPPLPKSKRARSVVNIASSSSELDVIVPQRKPVGRDGVSSSPALKLPGGIIDNGKLSGERSSVLHVRSGVHSGKSRFVMELDNPTRYKVAIDPLRNVLRVKLEHSYLRIEPKGVLTGTSLLGSYVARGQADGSVLIEVRLKKKSKILETMQLRPNDAARHRIVIDLKN